MATWKEWLEDLIGWAALNPWEFIFYVLLGLSPFFLASAILSWKLMKQLEAESKKKVKKSKRNANISEVRRAKSD